MTRSDPDRIYQAQRAGYVNRLATTRTTRQLAAAMIASLEEDAERLGLVRGSLDFWREAERRAAAAA